MKSITTDIVASERNEAFKNIIAITVQPSKVVVMQRVIARLMSFARRERIARLARSDMKRSGRTLSNLSSKTWARSMIRPSRLVMTARIAPSAPNDSVSVHYFLSIRRVEVCSRSEMEISLLGLVFDAVRVGASDALG
jgi:hypothetical protein